MVPLFDLTSQGVVKRSGLREMQAAADSPRTARRLFKKAFQQGRSDEEASRTMCHTLSLGAKRERRWKTFSKDCPGGRVR
jgi:hypothetical protein